LLRKKRSRKRTANQVVTPAAIAPTSAWPRTPSPALPISSGSFSTPAAPMIGVARRKAKRAASSLESPVSRPPPIVTPASTCAEVSAAAWAVLKTAKWSLVSAFRSSVDSEAIW